MPKIVTEVDLHPDSVAFIAKTLGMYAKSEGSLPTEFKQGVILHMRPTEDTRNLDSGDLNGYVDSLLFTLSIFDQSTMKVHEVQNRDGVDLAVTGFVRYFKDGSTMIVIRQPVRLLYSQNVHVVALGVS